MSLFPAIHFYKHSVVWRAFMSNPVGVHPRRLFTLICCFWMWVFRPLLSWPVSNLFKVSAFVSHEGRERKSCFWKGKPHVKSWPFSNKLAVYSNPRMIKLSLSENIFSTVYKGNPYVTGPSLFAAFQRTLLLYTDQLNFFPFDPLLTSSPAVCVQYVLVCLSGSTCTQEPVIQ